MIAQTLTIGKVASAVGIGIETVRFYERQGLIADPPRTPSGYRLYPPEAVDRLRFIRRAKDLGFTLQEVGELLSLRVAGGEPCEQVKGLAAAKLSDIERRIIELERMAGVIRQLVATCDAGTSSAPCPILNALAESNDAT